MRELVDTLNHAVRVAEGKTKELNQLNVTVVYEQGYNMKTILVLLGVLLAVAIIGSGLACATATSETMDSRAVPATLYGTTSGGDLVCFLVDTDGTLQTA